jgi:hypothetical protein
MFHRGRLCGAAGSVVGHAAAGGLLHEATVIDTKIMGVLQIPTAVATLLS